MWNHKYTHKKVTHEYIWMGGMYGKFYCREEELRKLNKRYHAGNFECIIIYGRRRVGKTTLINEFCKDKTDIYSFQH